MTEDNQTPFNLYYIAAFLYNEDYDLALKECKELQKNIEGLIEMSKY